MEKQFLNDINNLLFQRISDVTITSRVISAAFQSFTKNNLHGKGDFCLNDILQSCHPDFTRLIPRPGDLIFICDKRIKQLDKNCFFGIASLMAACMSFNLSVQHAYSMKYLQELRFIVIPLHKKKLIAKYSSSLTECGAVTGDGQLMLYTSEGLFNVDLQLMRSCSLASVSCAVSGNDLFLQGFSCYFNAFTACRNQKRISYFKIEFPHFESITDYLPYALGLYYAFTVFKLPFCFGERVENIARCDGNTLYYYNPTIDADMLPHFGALLVAYRNACTDKNAVIIPVEQSLKETVDNLLGDSYYLKNSVYPFPQAEKCAFIVVSDAKLRLPLLGTKTKLV